MRAEAFVEMVSLNLYGECPKSDPMHQVRFYATLVLNADETDTI